MNQSNVVSETFYTKVTEKLPELVAAPTSSLGRTLLHVAWMAILLGLIVEGLILIVAASFGTVIAGKPVNDSSEPFVHQFDVGFHAVRSAIGSDRAKQNLEFQRCEFGANRHQEITITEKLAATRTFSAAGNQA